MVSNRIGAVGLQYRAVVRMRCGIDRVPQRPKRQLDIQGSFYIPGRPIRTRDGVYELTPPDINEKGFKNGKLQLHELCSLLYLEMKLRKRLLPKENSLQRSESS